MARYSRWFAVLIVLCLGGVAAACGSEQQGLIPTDPEIRALFGESADGGGDGELVEEDGYSGATRTAAWIGEGGGELKLADHSLVVPAGAVDHAMCFTMELGPDAVIDVDLNAWEMDGPDQCDTEGDGDGTTGVRWTGEFAVPVQLSLTYARAIGLENPDDLVVAYLESSTEMHLLSSEVDTGAALVTTELEHFSMYALAVPF